MPMRPHAAAVLLALVFVSQTLRFPVQAAQNQSLAAVAERASAERKAATGSKTYGDADLKPVRDAAPLPTDVVLPADDVSATGQFSDIRREDVVRAVMPAVVTIESGSSTGSGFFVSADTVLTNRHVVDGAGSVRVRFSNGTQSSGYVSSTATDADLALVHVEQPPASHPTLRLAPARNVRVGEDVLAVGSALGMLQGTVTRGIVSAVRSSGGLTLVQTDAAINPGNSGGPLVNKAGAVVGITTSKMSAAESLGFAIATDHASRLLAGNTTVLTPGASGDAASLDAALGTAHTETDAMREQGEVQFERTVQALARQADEIDAAWERYRVACAGKYSVGVVVNGRAWFGLLGDTVLIDNETLPQCRAWHDDVSTNARRISDVMQQAEETARRAGVFPGTTRGIRARYAMEWPGWDR
ncbi:MAG: trypsin-like peptidase domain-containing protein [Vicinamibacterales bacterium]